MNRAASGANGEIGWRKGGYAHKEAVEAVKEYAASVGVDWREVARSIGVEVEHDQALCFHGAGRADRALFMVEYRRMGFDEVRFAEDIARLVTRVIWQHGQHSGFFTVSAAEHRRAPDPMSLYLTRLQGVAAVLPMSV